MSGRDSVSSSSSSTIILLMRSGDTDTQVGGISPSVTVGTKNGSPGKVSLATDLVVVFDTTSIRSQPTKRSSTHLIGPFPHARKWCTLTCSKFHSGVAQLVERLSVKEDVGGSKPSTGASGVEKWYLASLINWKLFDARKWFDSRLRYDKQLNKPIMVL